MAESAYENACNRAELLGLEQPDHDTFISDYETNSEAIDPQDLLDEEINAEILNGTFGKFDELNHILANTQVKIKRFRKRACSSFASYLKIRQEGADEATTATTSSSLDNKSAEDDSNENESITESNVKSNNEKDIQNGNDTVENVTASLNEMTYNTQELKSKSQELKKNTTSQLDKLDALLMKAENAQFSMASQNKQMKNMLK